jgi:methylenetetrahydrofolate--tRNA-(uracil-5-)-methyltransferase
MDVCWMAARWDKGGKDYINCPMDKAQYDAFVAALNEGEKTEFKEWEKDTPYFEGCMPIEVMAERGPETLRYGPMKGVGLDDPRTGRWPYAVVQLRQDNALGTLWNMVGFQTKLKHGEQVRIFRTIPGPRKCRVRAARRHPPQQLHQLARAARRRAAPEVEAQHPLRRPDHRLRRLCRKRRGRPPRRALRRRRAARRDTAAPRRSKPRSGALLGHITGGADAETYQPMNVNFGLMPPLEGRTKKADRKKAYTDRARAALRNG